ncbi:MAG: hypothetical protein U5L09_01270, partial [Bacteroidales bacterium]|nr:hypothetical protein [Bacteroidales bacterium]
YGMAALIKYIARDVWRILSRKMFDYIEKRQRTLSACLMRCYPNPLSVYYPGFSWIIAIQEKYIMTSA